MKCPVCTAAWPPTAGATCMPCSAVSPWPLQMSRRRLCGQGRGLADGPCHKQIQKMNFVYFTKIKSFYNALACGFPTMSSRMELMGVGRVMGAHPLEENAPFLGFPGRRRQGRSGAFHEYCLCYRLVFTQTEFTQPEDGAVSGLEQRHLHPWTLSKRRASSAHTDPRMKLVT